MIEIAGYSGLGGRECNEDSMLYQEFPGGLCMVVADGLGGHGGGKTASGTAAATILNGVLGAPSTDTDGESLAKLFSTANREVLGKQSPVCRMKTTCVSLVIRDGKAVWGHVGDSRLYHFINGRLVFQTQDHSVSQMAVMAGKITKAQIRFDEDRSRVLRALGAGAEVQPEISETQDMRKEFHAFLLCSDGFWEYVLEDEMEIDLAKSENPREWIHFMKERLEHRAGDDNDNFTAGAVFYRYEKREREEKG